jgi:hypothetical protein
MVVELIKVTFFSLSLILVDYAGSRLNGGMGSSG